MDVHLSLLAEVRTQAESQKHACNKYCKIERGQQVRIIHRNKQETVLEILNNGSSFTCTKGSIVVVYGDLGY